MLLISVNFSTLRFFLVSGQTSARKFLCLHSQNNLNFIKMAQKSINKDSLDEKSRLMLQIMKILDNQVRRMHFLGNILFSWNHICCLKC